MQKITNPIIQAFYTKFTTYRKINRDFYEILPEEKYNFRLVDANDKKSDSPRESLSHMLEVELTYLQGSMSGELIFTSLNINKYLKMNKEELLKEMTAIDEKLFQYLADSAFEPNREIKVPWGKSTALMVFYSLVDHEILHQGWNLALMDVLGIQRFASLKEVWGE